MGNGDIHPTKIKNKLFHRVIFKRSLLLKFKGTGVWMLILSTYSFTENSLSPTLILYRKKKKGIKITKIDSDKDSHDT